MSEIIQIHFRHPYAKILDEKLFLGISRTFDLLGNDEHYITQAKFKIGAQECSFTIGNSSVPTVSGAIYIKDIELLQGNLCISVDVSVVKFFNVKNSLTLGPINLISKLDLSTLILSK